MILSNLSILEAIKQRFLMIENLAGVDPACAPFNTSSVDLRLGHEIIIPKRAKKPLDLRCSYPGEMLYRTSKRVQISESKPYRLKPYTFVLGTTVEKVAFPRNPNGPCYSARVEGKSSRARFGLLVHMTAPTIHCDFTGLITLEIMNVGPTDIWLHPSVYICQLIVEQVDQQPYSAPNQFIGQQNPIGSENYT